MVNALVEIFARFKFAFDSQCIRENRKNKTLAKISRFTVYYFCS
jgi:hypothetical protein